MGWGMCVSHHEGLSVLVFVSECGTHPHLHFQKSQTPQSLTTPLSPPPPYFIPHCCNNPSLRTLLLEPASQTALYSTSHTWHCDALCAAMPSTLPARWQMLGEELHYSSASGNLAPLPSPPGWLPSGSQLPQN